MNIAEYKNHCCGCGECFAVCPADAITMKLNKQGFYYPSVDEKKCIDCSKCVKRCSFNNESERNEVKKSYALKHKDENVRAESRSGGVFTAVSDLILEKGGVVYGAQLFNCRTAKHTRATTKEQRDAFRGSKYIQSETHDIFKCVKEDLKKGLWVLFSGTSCQVNAIKDYCKDINCEKLFLVDIVCHGVPSPKVWADYVKFAEKKNKKKAVAVDFRDKKNFGWTAHKETVFYEDGSEYSDNIFTNLFYSHLILREDCFECPYRSLSRVGDISIADCWGITQNYPEFDDDKGVSLVMVNTEKGQMFFDNAKDTEYIDVDIQKLLQPPLRENWKKPVEYRGFWEYYYKKTFKESADKYVFKIVKESLFKKVKRKCRSLLGKVYRKIFDRK